MKSRRRRRGQSARDINACRKYVIFSCVQPRHTTPHITREEISLIGAWLFAMRDIDVQFIPAYYCGASLLCRLLSVFVFAGKVSRLECSGYPHHHYRRRRRRRRCCVVIIVIFIVIVAIPDGLTSAYERLDADKITKRDNCGR